MPCKRSLKLIQKILTEFRWYGSIYSSSTPHHLLFHLISDFLGTLYRSSLHPVVMLKPFPYSLENLAIQCGNNSQGNTSPVEMGHWNLPSLCSAIISLQINMDKQIGSSNLGSNRYTLSLDRWTGKFIYF